MRVSVIIGCEIWKLIFRLIGKDIGIWIEIRNNRECEWK